MIYLRYFREIWVATLDKYATDVHGAESWSHLIDNGRLTASPLLGNSATPYVINGRDTLPAAIAHRLAIEMPANVTGIRTYYNYHQSVTREEPTVSCSDEMLDKLTRYLGYEHFNDYLTRKKYSRDAVIVSSGKKPEPIRQRPTKNRYRPVLLVWAVLVGLCCFLSWGWYSEASKPALLKVGLPYEEAEMSKLLGVYASYNRGNVPRTRANSLRSCDSADRYHRMVWELYVSPDSQLVIRRKGRGRDSDTSLVRFEGVVTHINRGAGRIDFLLKETNDSNHGNARHFVCVNHDYKYMNCVCTSYTYTTGDVPLAVRELLVKLPQTADYQQEDASDCFPGKKAEPIAQPHLAGLDIWFTADPAAIVPQPFSPPDTKK
ncbi:hypothetical protein [Fibrella forsythiae]|uniref:DUF4178 domain-containing protein n=1 Tax=Fibrella forsythiae TaxID=2817061 RepID=A0ABS3JG65_9BACT|nr:hypothetical protein [Fibrella forsythiae]MBO0948990.1 hypothetical protein [Fibrella forsythiae]